MQEEVETFISNCAWCQKCRLGQGSMAAELHSTAVFEPWEVVAVDTVGPLPMEAGGFKYIVVFIDAFTHFVELRPVKSLPAMEAAKSFLEVFGRYGAPKYLCSDNGMQFVAG